jgi:hypothetical protein
MTGPEIAKFAAAMNQAYTEEEVRSLLLKLNRKLTDYVTMNVPFPNQLEQLVGAANSQAWVAQLVMEVVSNRAANPYVAQFLETFPGWDSSKNPLFTHPSEALSVFGGKSFIGRPDLRRFLKKMSSGDAKNVLLVTGERRQIGKTYSKELIAFLSAKQQPSQIVYVDLDSDNFDPAKLAGAIGKPMRLEATGIPSRGQQQASRWNQELSNWLIPEIPDARRIVWWIVLDGFRQKMPSEEVQDLIAQIAQRVQGTQDHRLILIDYTYPLPVAVSGFMFREKVVPIQKEEVQRFLEQVHRQRYGAAPGDQELTEYVTGVYERLAEYSQQHPEMADSHLLLNMAVTDAAEAIKEG